MEDFKEKSTVLGRHSNRGCPRRRAGSLVTSREERRTSENAGKLRRTSENVGELWRTLENVREREGMPENAGER